MVYYLVSKDKRFRSLNSKVEQTKIRFSFLLRTSHIPYSSKKYINFLHFVLFFIFLSILPSKMYAQCAGNDASVVISGFS